jgi:osmotically inducible protein OsmC
MNVLYTASVTSIGGRNGHVESSDGAIRIDLAAPPSLGGHGRGANPEQLFAAGYAACFAGAMDYLAQQQHLTPGEITIQSKVGIGPDDSGAFTLAVDLDVTAPGLDQVAAEKLVAQADRTCPYSRATRGNIEVKIVAHGGKSSS